MDVAANIADILKSLPKQPGVYRFLNDAGVIIYVGKAKNLKSRVTSYFRGFDNHPPKTKALVRKIADIQFFVVASEREAFLLENNLIKTLKPKYNILLKDDKTYPWICITNEPYPRVYKTRYLDRKEGNTYFGPYTDGTLITTLLSLIKSLYNLRSCKQRIDDLNRSSRKRECLEFHIGNCDAPCIGNISMEKYNTQINQIRSILNGHFSELIAEMHTLINEAVAELKFEEADRWKRAIEKLTNYRNSNAIVSTDPFDADIFTYAEDNDFAYVNFMRVVKGVVIQLFSVEIERKIEESRESVLSTAIFDIRQKIGDESQLILVPFLPDWQMEGVTYRIPMQGEKRRFLELSERNVRLFQNERERARINLEISARTEQKNNPVLSIIQTELHLPTLPYRVECFDNSNLQGTAPVASCVVFLNGKSCPKEYRKFNVETVVGANDFASMEEIVFRRYSRRINENAPLPDLVVIDGGKGQLHFAVNALRKLNLLDTVPVVGLAKRLEEVYFPNDTEPYLLAKNSQALRLLMQIRDEAHRFGITFHRQKRSKELINSELSTIKGIGDTSATSLLIHFGSVEKIKLATLEELSEVVGAKRALLVYNNFKSNS